jgi:hypothetical protein
MLKYACILAVTLRGKVNALAYMSTITTASRILCGGSGRTAAETQGYLENLIIAGFAQVAPDFIWLSFFFLDTKAGNVPSLELRACRCFRGCAPNRFPA